VSGVNGYRTANARHLLAMHLEGMDRYSDALPLRRTQLSILREERGVEEPWTLAAELHLGFNLAGLGEYNEARQLFVHARDAFERCEGPNSDGAVRASELIAWVDERSQLDSTAD